MIRICNNVFTRKWAISSQPHKRLAPRQPMLSLLISVGHVPKTNFSVKLTEPTINLRTYLNGINNANDIGDKELNEISALLRCDPLVDVDAIEVINCCGGKHVRQTHVLDDIWMELKSKSVPLNVRHYNALLRIYIEKEKMFEPRAIFDEIIGRGMKPNASTCNSLIMSCALRGDVLGSKDLFELMLKHEIAANESTYNHLILAYAVAGDMHGMGETFMTMKAKALRVDCNTLNNLLSGYAKAGDSDRLNETLKLYETENIELLNSDLLTVITGLATNGHSDKCDAFFNRLFKSIEYRYSAKDFIAHSVQHRQFDLIEKLLANNADRCPVASLVQHYLAEAVKASCTEDDINRIWRHSETLGITIDSNIGVFFPAALRSSSTSLVRATLDGMKAQALQIRDEHFKHLCLLESAKSPDAVLDVMRLMRSDFNVRPRSTMIRDTFLPLYEYHRRPQLAVAKLHTLDLNINAILTAVITRCILDGQLRHAVEIAKVYKNHYFIATQYGPYLVRAIQHTEDLDSFVSFVRILHDDIKRLHDYVGRLHAAPKPSKATPNQMTKEQIMEALYFSVIEIDEVQAVGEIIRDAIVELNGNLDEIEKLLGRLLSEGLRISTDIGMKIKSQLKLESSSSVASLLEQLSTAELIPRKLPKSTNLISPLKLLSPDELITLIEMAESRGKSVAGSKRLLFHAYIDENNLLAAEDLLFDTDFEHSQKMYTDLISLCLKQKDVDKALDYFECAKSQFAEFNLHRTDAMKIVAMLLLRGHKYDEIKQMMLAKGMDSTFLEGEIPSAANQLLQGAAESRDIDLTVKLFDHLTKNKYIKPNVQTTGALVNVHLKNDNVIDAFNTFESIYEKYRCTPFKLNLFCKLIERDDMNRLEQLFDIVVDAHGEHIALRVLAYAFIEAGRIEQATIVLSNHLLSESDFLRRDCNYFYKRGRTDILQGLLKATRDLDFDRTHIYRCLFLHNCNSKQEQPAVDVFGLGEIPKHIPPRDQSAPVEVEVKLDSNIKKTKSMSDIVKTANVTAANASDAIEAGSGLSEEEQFNEKLRHLMSQNADPIFMATELILAGIKSKLSIDPSLVSQFLAKVADMGDASVYDALWSLPEIRKSPDFDRLYLQAHLNGSDPTQYIHRIGKLIDSTHRKEHNDIDKVICIADNLRFLQEHPDVIDEYEAMAIRAVNAKTYAPINVVWMYHFISESPFIESLWSQYFATEPDHFQTSAMLSILVEERSHSKLEQLACFLATNDRLDDAASVWNTQLRIHVDANCFAEAIKILETWSIPLKYIDRTILGEIRQHFEANGKTIPISIEQFS